MASRMARLDDKVPREEREDRARAMCGDHWLLHESGVGKDARTKLVHGSRPQGNLVAT